MQKILIGILLSLCTSLFAEDAISNAEVVRGYGAGVASIMNQKMNINTMNDADRMRACENTIRSSGMDQNRPFLENYNQAMKIAVNECVKDLK